MTPVTVARPAQTALATPKPRAREGFALAGALLALVVVGGRGHGGAVPGARRRLVRDA